MQPSSSEQKGRDFCVYVEKNSGIVFAYVVLSVFLIFTIGWLFETTTNNRHPMAGFVSGVMAVLMFWMSYKYGDNKKHPRLYLAVIIGGFFSAITILLFTAYNFYHQGWTLDPCGILERNGKLRMWLTAYIFLCALWAWILWKHPVPATKS